MTLLSLIVPVYNESPNVPLVYDRLRAVAPQIPDLRMEIVFVDDGSADDSADAVRRLPGDGPGVRLVQLARNFGSHAALAAGVAHVRGDVLSFLAADLQDPPDLLVEMVRLWRAGTDVVWGTRASRQDPFLTRIFSGAYYSLLRKWALPLMPKGGVDFCLVDRGVVRSLGDLQERNTNIFNLLLWSGFRQAFIPYHRQPRKIGSSKFTMSKKLKLFADSFVAFSFAPIRLVSALGGLLSMAGLVYALFIIVGKLTLGELITGWASLMVVVLLTSGVQLLMLGIVAEYLWRVLDATRNRPMFLVRGVFDVPASEEPAFDHHSSRTTGPERVPDASRPNSSLRPPPQG